MNERYATRRGFWHAQVIASGDDFRYRYFIDRVHLPWSEIRHFYIETFHDADTDPWVRLVVRRAPNEHGLESTRRLHGLNWRDARYAEAVRVRDWLNSYVARHGRRPERR